MDIAWLITNFTAAWLLPPLNLIALGALGLALRRRRPRLGTALLAIMMLGLPLLSLQAVGDRLLAAVETPYIPIDPAQGEAIVVLGGGRYEDAPEYAADTVGRFTLERLRYATDLQRRTGRPVLVTGGAPEGGVAEATLMARVLKADFGVSVFWIEDQSNTTRQNAVYSAQLLSAHGIRRIWLVSHAWHLTRAIPEFERLGLEVIPAGTGYAKTRPDRPLDYVPSLKGLQHSALAFHEAIGIIWYRILNWGK